MVDQHHWSTAVQWFIHERKRWYFRFHWNIMNLNSLMFSCDRYFEESATKEILELCCPYLNPWTTESPVLSQLILFLPVTIPCSKAAIGHELWFDKLMEFWSVCSNTHENILVSIVSSVFFVFRKINIFL